MSCPHCTEREPLTLQECFEQCCIAFDQCEAALAARDHEAFLEAREVHAAYAQLHDHLLNGGLVQ